MLAKALSFIFHIIPSLNLFKGIYKIKSEYPHGLSLHLNTTKIPYLYYFAFIHV